jgi:hypothetical protein
LPRGRWPEFAEQDCFACHHDLQSPSLRQAQGGRGVPEANRWHTAMLPAALAALDGEGDADLQARITELQTALRSWQPKRETVATNADAAAEHLRRWLERWRSEESAARFDAALMRGLGDAPGSGWIELMQRRNTLAAVQRNRMDAGLPALPWRSRLEELNRLLRLPPGFDSPRGFGPARTPGEGRP